MTGKIMQRKIKALRVESLMPSSGSIKSDSFPPYQIGHKLSGLTYRPAEHSPALSSFVGANHCKINASAIAVITLDRIFSVQTWISGAYPIE